MNCFPSVNQFIDKIKSDDDLKDLEIDIITRYARSYLKKIKISAPAALSKNTPIISQNKATEIKQDILDEFVSEIKSILVSPFKSVINGNGVLLHTNLGRAPISENAFDLIKNNLIRYTNIEFDLKSGKRAYRDDFLKDIFHFIIGSEDVVVVNNNASALYLILKTFITSTPVAQCQHCKTEQDISKKNNKREVIVSRGELMEIGGSFRIPDILVATGAILREVGTTNCTRLSDYENAINDNTAVVLKVHTSNYSIKGHTQSVDICDLVPLSRKYNIPLVYDAGSGLIKKLNPKTILSNHEKQIDHDLFDNKEVTISESIEKGVDIVCFSGDKLLGGLQAGIILGKEMFLKPMKKNPLMRVLRADKLTICNLYHHISMFKNEKELLKNNKVYSLLSQSIETLHQKACLLSERLLSHNINNKILESYAYTGGGSLPDTKLKSFEIQLDLKEFAIQAEDLYYELLKCDNPVLCVLKERKIFINVFAIDIEDIPHIVECIQKIVCISSF